MDSDATGAAFVAVSRSQITGEYLPKIRASVERMSEADLWWRPNENSNSTGNLILHLAGNLRQWIAHGVGGQENVRDRPQEFAASGGMGVAQVLEVLEGAVGTADQILADLDPARLLERRTIQGMDVSVLAAIYHVVEHFAGHTYQIMYIAKARTGEDLGFWTIQEGRAIPTW